ncbi:MAG: tetratricopeptide repeat protein [Chloroflexota bacterium]|nr:tetratricopeptide repeat protein [Chloroflexota bacterium]
MSDRAPLADVLGRYARARGYSFEKLAEASGLPRNTVYRWLHGDVTKPQTWQPLAIVAAALRLSKAQTNTLLQAANHPTIERLLARARTDQDRVLLAPWTVSVPNNLPGQLTSFVGREEEGALVVELIASSRLVTLTGPGGSGKTRLALQAAETVLGDFGDGVYFVGLAPIREPALVLSAVSNALGLPQTPGEPTIDVLKAQLRDKRMLLLLDNFEQVIEAAPLLVELLVAAPRVKTLVTSRTRLNVPGEHEYQVPPLVAPAATASFQELRANPAVTLFAARARAVNPAFALTPENAPLVAEITARLDGLPLAIELAAGRTRHFGLRAMLERFPSRLDLGSDGPRGVSRRHQSLRYAISWSHDLLRPEAQKVFRRLAVFAGGCPEDAVMAVACLPGEPGLDVSAALIGLVESSLLRQTSPADSERRFELLETIREYALECLQESGELEATLQAHADYYLGLAEAAERELEGPAQRCWLDRLDREHENFRAALEWCSERGEGIKGLRLCVALMPLWWLRDRHVEGRRWLETFIPTAHEAPPQLQGKALLWQGLLLMRYAGGAAAAESLYDRALALFQECGDLRGASETLQAQGEAVLNRCEVARARPLFAQSVELAREAGSDYLAAHGYLGLALCAQEEEEYEAAQRYWELMLEWAQRAGNKASIALALNSLGEMARYRRDLEDAECYYQRSLELARELDSEWRIALALHNLGYIACYRGEHERALELFSESLSLYEQRHYRKGVGECLAGLAATAAFLGELERAARLCGAAAALLESLGTHLDTLDRADFERTLCKLRCELGEEGLEELRTEGRKMPLERAVELATKRLALPKH